MAAVAVPGVLPDSKTGGRGRVRGVIITIMFPRSIPPVQLGQPDGGAGKAEKMQSALLNGGAGFVPHTYLFYARSRLRSRLRDLNINNNNLILLN